MSTSETSMKGNGTRTLHGIVCVVLGMFLFAAQDAMMKTLITEYPIWILIFVRSMVSVLVLVPLITVLGHPHRLKSPFWKLHVLRATLFVIGFSLFYAAFPFMGLAEATTIFFSAPLIIAVMAVVFLKERIGLHRSGALIMGFVGVVIAINPTADGFNWVAFLPLICAFFYAGSQILARKIGEQESSLTVGLYTLALTAPIVALMGYGLNLMIDFEGEYRHLQWVLPGAVFSDVPRLFFLGLLGMCAYVLISRAYQVADASAVAPFDYTYLPIATAVAWIFWQEVPPVNTVIGMALIVSSGLYIGFREVRLRDSDDETAYVAEAIIAPNTPHPAQIPEAQSEGESRF